MSTSTLSTVLAIVLAVAVLGAAWWVASSRRDQSAEAPSDELPLVDLDVAVRSALIAVFGGVGLLAFAIVAFGFSSWQGMSVLYLDVVVALPLISTGLLLGGCRGAKGPLVRLTRPVVVVAVIALLAAPLGVYMTHREPYELRTDTQVVSVAPQRSGSDPVRIGVISDIQTIEVTDHERAAAQRVLDAEPDIILIPGDVFQGSQAQFAATQGALRDLFSSMRAPGGVYLVLGDVDREDVLGDLVAGTDVELLVNETARTTVGDREIVIGGVELERTVAGRVVLDELRAAPGDEVRILLSHRPDWALELDPGSRVDLVVSGHTHGGQVQLPFYGPLITMSEVPRAVAAGGLHDLAGNQIYVSPGVGREQQGAPQIRLLAPPEVGILTLEG